MLPDPRRGDRIGRWLDLADGACAYCADGLYTSCPEGGFWGEPGSDGGQGEAARVPHADATLVSVPGGEPDPDRIPALLALADRIIALGRNPARTAIARAFGATDVVGERACLRAGWIRHRCSM